MGNMMRRGRVNPTCKCCNIADDPGWRTREKNDWKKEVEEEMTDNFGLLNDREEAFINAFKEGIRREERERIISLLDAEHSEYTYQHQENKKAYIDDCAACFAIAIIKGEN